MKIIALLIITFSLSINSYSQNNSLVFYSKNDASFEQKNAAKALGLFTSKVGRCNAFLLTDNIIITNEHCLDENESTTYSITFNFGEDDQETFNCKKILYKNKELDFALLELEVMPQKNKYGISKYPKVVFANKKLKKNDSILLINFNQDNPNYNGDIYQIFSKGTILEDEQTKDPKLYYIALAQGGSSGSAVFSKNERDGKYYFVGLHNVGYGDIFQNGYKGGVSADLIYDKIISLNNSEIDDVSIERGFLGDKQLTYYKNSKIKSVGYYLPDRHKVYKDSDLGRKRGKWLEYYQNGTLKNKEVYNIYSGFRSGEWVKHYPSGKTYSITNYKSDLNDEFNFDIIKNHFGILHGKSSKFYKTGKLQYTGKYTNGQKTGIWINYRPDGSVNFVLNYDRPETLNQFVQYYDQHKGQLYMSGNLKNGLHDGVFKLFNQSGPIWTANIKPNFRIFNNKNENIGMKLLFKEGKQVGMRDNIDLNRYAYHDSNNTKILYICDFFENKCIYYYPNGKIKYERTYSVKGILGNFTKAFDNKGNSILNNGNGYIYDYYNNGQKKYIAEIRNGCLDGEIIYYTDQGEIISENILKSCEIDQPLDILEIIKYK